MMRVDRFTKGRIWGGRGKSCPSTIKPGVYGWLGNPHAMKVTADPDIERQRVIGLFQEYFLNCVGTSAEFRAAVLALRGKPVACCPLGKPCHLDVVGAWLEDHPE